MHFLSVGWGRLLCNQAGQVIQYAVEDSGDDAAGIPDGWNSACHTISLVVSVLACTRISGTKPVTGIGPQITRPVEVLSLVEQLPDYLAAFREDRNARAGEVFAAGVGDGREPGMQRIEVRDEGPGVLRVDRLGLTLLYVDRRHGTASLLRRLLWTAKGQEPLGAARMRWLPQPGRRVPFSTLHRGAQQGGGPREDGLCDAPR
ncbi:hypothetical protein Stube_69640 [Streptomyces tubercidicus]|uniref:Uncharacterized protein n=1 Tax=Streptomyces tubercidicus TaxID=47759 RepID=A0A640V5J1_9ACTN|nr:hypothetical protein Stube_69640 [Streptomyces tubercidicus]